MSFIYVPIVIVTATALTPEQLSATAIARAEDVSKKLWELSRPLTVRNPDDTLFFCKWIQHPDWIIKTPLTGSVMLELPQSQTIPIDVQADSSIIPNLLQEFVEAGFVSASEVSDLIDSVDLFRGQQVNLFDFFPQFWKNQAKTKEQLTIEGWFPPLIP